MTNNNDKELIVEKLIQFFISEFPDHDSELTPDTDLLSEWLVDSLAIVNTTMFLENNFGLQLTRADISAQNFRSASALADFILSRKQ